MKLFFDTETTGKVDFRAMPDAPHQPRLVQLAALLTDDTGKELASLNCIVIPDGFSIPAEATAVHGIDNLTAVNFGLDLTAVMPVFRRLLQKAHTIVAHNIDFDEMVMRGEFLRDLQEDPFDDDSSLKRFCTMRAMTPICKLPNPSGYDDYKWPKLQEAYHHAFGKDFEGAHDAMADVRACAAIYFWIVNGGAK